jgi:serine/threonine-protein kinase
MINPKGQVKLLDFGIAKNTDTNSAEYTQTSTSQQMGTPMYMSPEQVNETKSVTAQSDIYSLGVVLWQMVMGQKPYDTKTLSNFELQLKIVQEPLALTQTIWDSCIQKATHKNLESRYTSTHVFLNDLQNPVAAKVDKTVFEKNDDKTIFENKEEATIIENKKAQTITPKEEKAQPTSKAEVKTEKATQNLPDNSNATNSKSKLWVVISVIIIILGIGGLLIFKNLGTSKEEMAAAEFQAARTTDSIAAAEESMRWADSAAAEASTETIEAPLSPAAPVNEYEVFDAEPSYSNAPNVYDTPAAETPTEPAYY